MEDELEIQNEDIFEIKKMLDTMHKDVRRLIEKSNQQQIELIVANSKKDFLNAVTDYIKQDIEDGLEAGMVEECHMRDTCKSRFTDLLEENAGLIKQGNVPEENVTENKTRLGELKKTAQFDKCDECFSEVSTLFNKQVTMMRSLRLYSTTKEKKKDISLICEEVMVKDVLDPLSNSQRLQILKSMTAETRTFSALSELTSLRGGNLLFHLQKLLESDMIIQRHERGDYIITEKGYKLLIMLAEMNEILNEELSTIL
jgi:hypothetical protein